VRSRGLEVQGDAGLELGEEIARNGSGAVNAQDRGAVGSEQLTAKGTCVDQRGQEGESGKYVPGASPPSSTTFRPASGGPDMMLT
jgi:hypothetical protein